MLFSVMTFFPEIIESVMYTSITGKALDKGILQLATVQIRDFAVNRYGKADDYLYGGGTGMLMMAEPVFQSWQSLTNQHGKPDRTIFLSPKGTRFTQARALELSGLQHIAFLCGHYEGIDQRVVDEIIDEEISIGDFVLTGGELAACVVMDAVARLVPEVLPQEQAYLNESHMNSLLEHPQYTRPVYWRGNKAPDVLLSGHQANIDRWHKLASLAETLRKRPDLFVDAGISEKEWQDLIEYLMASESDLSH